MFRIFFAIVMCVCVLAASGEALANSPPVVSNVTASQRTDGSNLVDIRYNLYDADGDKCTVSIKVSSDGGATWNVSATTLSGHVGAGVWPGTNRHIVWNAGVDQPGLVGSNFKVRVCADDSHQGTPPDPGFGPMALVPAGSFKTSTGVWVYMSSYYIDIYEVTNTLYAQFLNSGGKDSHWRSGMNGEIARSGTAGNYTYSVVSGWGQRPVRRVTWYDAVAFCDWRSAAEGMPQGTYHLPTEAQWEKAAGWDPEAGKLWTYGFRGSDTIDCSKANYWGVSGGCVGTTSNVGSYHPWRSYYGLYDASGNVGEWCQDWWGGTYPSGTSNPTGPSSGSYKVLRGGGWDTDEYFCRVGSRFNYYPTCWGTYFGFRCARTLD